MLKQATECHIVNTASAAGLMAGADLGIYTVTKHSVVSISETLYYEFAKREANINVSVLCPGFVHTQIMDAERNRPIDRRNTQEHTPSVDPATVQFMVDHVQQGIAPEQVAEAVFTAIRNEQLYILTHPELNGAIQTRLENILAQRNPSLT